MQEEPILIEWELKGNMIFNCPLTMTHRTFDLYQSDKIEDV
jgi:hypothetical protein